MNYSSKDDITIITTMTLKHMWGFRGSGPYGDRPTGQVEGVEGAASLVGVLGATPVEGARGQRP